MCKVSKLCQCRIIYQQVSLRNQKYTNKNRIFQREAWWPSGRASDSGARGQCFDPHSGRRVVRFTSQKVLVILRKQWLCPDMTEKSLTWT